MKLIYFVRHGESVSNASGIYMGAESPLTQKGIEQSTFLAQRFKSIPIDSIIVSPFVRTKETATIFNKLLNKPFKYSDLFVERKRPSEMNGLNSKDSEYKKIDVAIKENFHKQGWYYSDEENFNDLKIRAQKALDLLTTQSESKIAVITHGEFMRVMVSLMMFGEDLDSYIYTHIGLFMKTRNTGITICEYNEEDNAWNMLAWMDHAHLGVA